MSTKCVDTTIYKSSNSRGYHLPCSSSSMMVAVGPGTAATVATAGEWRPLGSPPGDWRREEGGGGGGGG